MTDGTPAMCCDLCGEGLGIGRPWVMLNRYVVGDGVVRQYVLWRDNDGDEVWDVDEGRCGGYQLCLDPCLRTWIDGRLIEARVALRKERERG